MPQRWNETVRLDKAIRQHLGSGLRATYHDVVGEPVPLEQIELVLALRRREREHRREASRPEAARPQG
jgi:hypothetical protein